MKAVRKLVIFLLLIEFAILDREPIVVNKTKSVEFDNIKANNKTFDYEFQIDDSSVYNYTIFRTHDTSDDNSSSPMLIYLDVKKMNHI